MANITNVSELVRCVVLVKKCFGLFLAVAILLSSPSALGAETESARYFSVTGHAVSGDFLRFFDARGGLDVFGYPRTEQFTENGRLVQYFQRQRMELWPENPEPYKVQLMLIGNLVLGPGEPPVSPPSDPGARYYPETGHTLAVDFKDFFDSRGGLDIFGYPITESRQEGGRLIQHFQRGRFELSESGLVTLGLLGDEYIYGLGGVPLALTAPASQTTIAVPGPEKASQAGASSRLVFQKAVGGAIFTISPDGSDVKQIATGMDPALSSDGQLLAYASWDYPQGIRILNLQTGEDVLAYSVEQPRAPAWSPDGGSIAFYVKKPGYRRGRFGRLEDDDFFNVVVLDIAARKTWNPPGQPAHSFSPSWSPDGSQLVYKGDSGLYLGSATSIDLIDRTDTRFAFPAWSPDGQRIALMYQQHDHWEIGIMNLDGSGLRLLTSSLPFTKPANNVAPAWSPDGRELAFVSDRDGQWKIYTMNADGSGQRKLTDEAIEYSWSMERVVHWSKN